MKKKNTKIASGKPKIEFVPNPNATQVYVNSTQIISTPFDMHLKMGEVKSVSPEKVIIDERVRLIMSAEHAKELFLVLGERLQLFEATHGPIRNVRKVNQPKKAAASNESEQPS